MSVSKKKIVRKKVTVKNFELTKRNLKSKYSKWKLFIAKRLNLELADNYQYLFRIQYYGSARLSPNDIVVTKQGIIFVVVQEHNRMAMVVTKDAFPNKPSLHGHLIILEK